MFSGCPVSNCSFAHKEMSYQSVIGHLNSGTDCSVDIGCRIFGCQGKFKRCQWRNHLDECETFMIDCIYCKDDENNRGIYLKKMLQGLRDHRCPTIYQNMYDNVVAQNKSLTLKNESLMEIYEPKKTFCYLKLTNAQRWYLEEKEYQKYNLYNIPRALLYFSVFFLPYMINQIRYLIN